VLEDITPYGPPVYDFYVGDHECPIAGFAPCFRSENEYPNGYLSTKNGILGTWSIDHRLVDVNAKLPAWEDITYARQRALPSMQDITEHYYVGAEKVWIDCNDIVRLADGNGFCSANGFSYTKNFDSVVFSGTSIAANGTASVFMWPDKGALKYSYDPSLYNPEPDHTVATITLGEVNVGNWPFYPVYTVLNRNNTDNIVDDTYAGTGTFGIPCKCEEGTHTILGWGGVGAWDVFLDIEEHTDNRVTAKYIKKIILTDVPDNCICKIKIGYFEGVTVDTLVTMKAMVYE
jgi:hypothetical protein